MVPSLAISLPRIKPWRPWASKAKLQPGRPIPHQVITRALGKLHLETKSAMAVLDPNGPRTRGPHAPKPRTGRTRETNGRTQMAQLTGQLLAYWRSAATMGFRKCSCVSCVCERFKFSRWESGRGRCNILAVYVGGQRAQNGQGLALRRDGKGIEAKRNLLEPNCSVDQHGTPESVAGLSCLSGSLDGWSGLCSWLDRPANSPITPCRWDFRGFMRRTGQHRVPRPSLLSLDPPSQSAQKQDLHAVPSRFSRSCADSLA